MYCEAFTLSRLQYKPCIFTTQIANLDHFRSIHWRIPSFFWATVNRAHTHIVALCFIVSIPVSQYHIPMVVPPVDQHDFMVLVSLPVWMGHRFPFSKSLCLKLLNVF